MKGPRIVKKKSINSENDPYLLKKSPEDMAVCKKCGAVYHSKRWSLERKPVLPKAKRSAVICPACQKILEGFAEGYITIRVSFVKAHKDEIINLIRNKEEISSRCNPLGRIMDIKDLGDRLEVTTTTEKLAQRIGRMIKKAFDGELEYKWSADVKLARVVWTREAKAAAKK